MKHPSPSPRSQQGAVIVLVALAIVMLLGFAGLIVDLGRMFVIKTELQNATDACALAAARELTCDPSALGGGNCPASFLQSAQDAGIAVGNRNTVNLQSAYAAFTADDIKFSTVLSNGGSDSVYQTIAGGADPNSKYVMCSLPQTGITMTFMRLLGFGSQTVNAMAVATLAPSVTSCAIPLGVCEGPNSQGASNNFDIPTGQWSTGLYQPGSQVTGSYNWIDFPNADGTVPTGSNYLSNLIAGTGQCNLPPAGSTIYDSQGQQTNLTKAWNSRFGLYAAGFTASVNAPDRTGIAYTNASTPNETSISWPCGSNAYGGNPAQCTDASGNTANVPNFIQAQAQNLPYQWPPNPMGLTPSYSNSSSSVLAAVGTNRRLAVAPIVDCSQLAGTSKKTTVLGWACVLMLNPISPTGGAGQVSVEYEGLANTPGNACATSGLPGGSIGPLVPSLVQ